MTDKTHNIYADIAALTRLQYQAKEFSFKPKQPVNSVLSGKQISKLRGRGLNFEELRHYRPGDDIRSMDWKVTRRTGKPHVKVYTEERERNVYLAIDQRASMFFGSSKKMKSVVGAEVAALIAWRVIATGDRVGALVFNDHNLKVINAKRSKQHVVSLLNEVIKQNHQLKSGHVEQNPSTSFNSMLAKLGNICRHDALIIYVGDGNGWNDKSTDLLKHLRQHNEIIAVKVFDPLERKLPEMSQMLVSDGRYQIQFSSDNSKTQTEYELNLAAQLSEYTKAANKLRIPLLAIDTISPAAQQLRKAMGQANR
ncbi:MAG: DUF58 domain-containing protein [Paraglaciecola polaris]|jgi:uncharacterized protein (DUF58 family)|uniref:DUF58 domain-containing protein n=1 Tax=Paraglaciecola polaris TaxID=222814 RepID=UPI003003480B|tara:strand:- start:618 stop:1547 length:930 start_codon:yes stop_codon:yes gene_type:complete